MSAGDWIEIALVGLGIGLVGGGVWLAIEILAEWLGEP